MFKKALQLFSFLLLIDLINLGCVCSHLKDYPRNCNGNFVGAQFNIRPDVNTSLSTKDTIISIPFNNLILECGLTIQNFDCVKNKYNGFIISQAQACKPAIINITKVLDSLIDFNITTVRNYNATYTSGANMSNIVEQNIVEAKSKAQTKGVLTASEIVKIYNANLSAVQDFNYLQHQLTLNQKPTNSGDTVQFAIAYILSNGIILKDTTSKIVLSY